MRFHVADRRFVSADLPSAARAEHNFQSCIPFSRPDKGKPLSERNEVQKRNLSFFGDSPLARHIDLALAAAEARRILGDEYIIGGTANTYEDVKKHWLNGVNYIGCGPFRYTTTKQKLSPILGLEGYKEIIRKMQEEKICHLPVVAIGGITFADIPAIMQTGVTGIALSGTVLRADNPVEEMRKILAVINQTDNY